MLIEECRWVTHQRKYNFKRDLLKTSCFNLKNNLNGGNLEFQEYIYSSVCFLCTWSALGLRDKFSFDFI